MAIKAETILGFMGKNESGSLAKKVDEFRINCKEVNDLLASVSADDMALQLLVIKHYCLADVKATASKRGIKRDALKAVKYLTGKAEKEGHYDWARYVFPNKGTKDKYCVTDCHMAISAPKESYDIPQAYFVEWAIKNHKKGSDLHSTPMGYPDVSRVIPAKLPKHKGTITKADVTEWKQRMRAEKDVDKWGKYYVPVSFDNGVVRLFHRDYLTCAMNFLGADTLTLYTGKTKQGQGVGYIKEGDIEMVICPIIVRKQEGFWYEYLLTHNNKEEA